MSSPEPSGWSIDELAQLVGVPSRTIREYRTQGLLTPPRKVGRVGVYDEAHRRRLELIGRMQARGYSLAGMRDLFEAWDRGESLEDVIGDSGLDEAPLTLTDEELAQRVAAFSDADARATAAAAGLMHPSGDGRWHVRAPSLLSLIEDAIDAGVPLDAALATAARMRDGARQQAEQVAAIFVNHLWGRDEGADVERLARRSRVLIPRAAAALVVDELGIALRKHAEAAGDDGLDALVDAIRVGAFAEHSHHETRMA
jgi:DNA-binding transcriptional MerR regulator